MLKQQLTLVPARRDFYQAKLLFWVFIASLGMFFVAALISYCVVRQQAFQPTVVVGSGGGAETVLLHYEALRIPFSFWSSTALLLLASLFLQRAVWLVHRERQLEFRRWLMWAWCAGVVFMIVQSVGMHQLFEHHFTKVDGSTKVYGMSFTLAVVHAAHVIGGMGLLGFVIYGALQNRYDHERHWAVDHCAGYWHFLGVVWICMLVMFAVAK